MLTLRELAGLGARTLTLCWLGRWRLGAWFCAGFALHLLGLEVSAILGAGHDLVATLAFVLGVTAQLLALIAMINTLRPLLGSPLLLEQGRPAELPDALLRPEPFLIMVTAALGPFLAVYAVWGLIEDEARALFTANIAEQGLGGVLQWSISWAPARLPFYLVLFGAAWVLRLALRQVLRRLPAPGSLGVLGVAIEAVVAFASFAVLIIATQSALTWLRSRRVVVGLHDLGRALVDALPPLRLPFDLTLPTAVDRVAGWLVGTGLPVLAHSVLLPLMWLALAAIVFGWREFLGRELVAGTAWQHRAERLGAGVDRVTRHVPLRRATLAVTGDLRTKYLPVLHALRLVLGSGPRFLGAYLVLNAAITALADVVLTLVSLVIGPTSGRAALAFDPFLSLLSGLLAQPLSVALYVAAFDRVVSDRAGVTAAAGTPRRSSTASPAARAAEPTPAPGS